MKKFLGLLCVALMAALAVAQNALPTGTPFKVKLETTVSTFSSHVGDPFRGRLIDNIVVDGKTILPAGALVEGRVTKLSEPRRIQGKPTIGLFPENIILPSGERHMLNAVLVDTNMGKGTDVNEEGQFKGDGHDRRDQVWVAGGTGGGMLVGGLIGGPPGVLVGGIVGAGATTTKWLSQHRSAILPPGTELYMELSRPLEMNVAAANGQ